MAEIIVTSTADSGAGSLRQAIADAQDGDVILFDPIVFPPGQTTSILLSSYITINQSVSIYGGESDGAGGYTSGATKRFYVYRDVEGVKTKTYITDDNPAQDGETLLFELVCRVALDGQEVHRCIFSSFTGVAVVSGIAAFNGQEQAAGTAGGGATIRGASHFTFNDCAFVNCLAEAGGCFQAADATINFDGCVFADGSATNGGGLYANNSATNTLSNCIFDGCIATTYGGGVFSTNTSRNTLTDCVFSGNSATNGGGVIASETSQNTLTDCAILNCSATNGGGVYSSTSSQNTLNGCTITGCNATNYGGGLYAVGTSQNTLNDCNISGCSATNGGGVRAQSTVNVALNNCAFINCTASNVGGGVNTSDTASVFVNACTFDSSDIYFGGSSTTTFSASTVEGINGASTARLVVDNGVTTFATAQLSTQTITIADGAALTITDTATIGAATFTSEGRGYLAIPVGVDASNAILTNVVLCDYCPDKTYYYIGGSEGSFAASSDWSTSKGGAALRYAPVANGYDFVVETGESDVAFTKGAEPFSGATVVLSGPATVSATVDAATFDVEAFTGALVLTGDVAITGDASAVDVTVDGTLRVAGTQKISSLTLAEGSNVAFSAANDVLAVTTRATLNNATFTCSEPDAYFAAPDGTDSESATFTNVLAVVVGAGVTEVAGVRAGKNYTINIFSTDNTKPVIVEYKGAGDSEWTVANAAFVGSTYRVRVETEDELAFRVYDGENFTSATIKSYGVYHEMAAKVDIGYLK